MATSVMQLAIKLGIESSRVDDHHILIKENEFNQQLFTAQLFTAKRKKERQYYYTRLTRTLSAHPSVSQKKLRASYRPGHWPATRAPPSRRYCRPETAVSSPQRPTRPCTAGPVRTTLPSPQKTHRPRCHNVTSRNIYQRNRK